MEKEIWKSVPGYEGLYEVSNLGRVRSNDRVDSVGRLRKGQTLKPIRHNKGYVYVNLHSDRGIKKEYIHRLVARAFLGEPIQGHDVDHVNRRRNDNTVANLRYLPVRANRGQSAESKRVKVKQLSKGGRFIAEYASIIEASRETGIHRSCISGVLRGRCTTAGGFIWRRA